MTKNTAYQIVYDSKADALIVSQPGAPSFATLYRHGGHAVLPNPNSVLKGGVVEAWSFGVSAIAYFWGSLTAPARDAMLAQYGAPASKSKPKKACKPPEDDEEPPSTTESCVQADQFCLAAANFEHRPRLRTKCYHCNEPVCTKCSTKRMHRGKLRRFCNDCQISVLDDGSDKIVRARLMKLAGY